MNLNALKATLHIAEFRYTLGKIYKAESVPGLFVVERLEIGRNAEGYFAQIRRIIQHALAANAEPAPLTIGTANLKGTGLCQRTIAF